MRSAAAWRSKLAVLLLYRWAGRTDGCAYCPALGSVKAPKVVVSGLEFTLTAPVLAPVLHSGPRDAAPNGCAELRSLAWRVQSAGTGEDVCSGAVHLMDPRGFFTESLTFRCKLGLADRNVELRVQAVSAEGCNACATSKPFFIHVVPGFLTLIPVVLTIFLALVTKEVYSSMFLGIWFGSSLVNKYNPFVGLLRVLDEYLPNAIATGFSRKLVIFSLSMSGFSALINRSGGVEGIKKHITKYVTSASKAQLAGWLLGILFFIDGNGSILIVGTMLVPIMDKFKVSPEKLAFIVDCTTAPIMSIVPVSSWIGYEVGLIQTELDALGVEESPFMAFMSTIPLRFYPFGMLVVGLAIVLLQRDVGPMYSAEVARRAPSEERATYLEAIGCCGLAAKRPASRKAPGKEAKEKIEVDHSMDPVGPSYGGTFTGAKDYACLAIIPIVGLVTTVCVGLPLSGYFELKDAPGSFDFKDTIGAAKTSDVLVWSGFVGLCINLFLLRLYKVMGLTDTLMTWINGMKLFLPPVLILMHAWAIGAIQKELMMPQYIVASMGDSIPKEILPTLVFVLAGIISFSTGTSWGTMAALFPMVAPLSWAVAGQSPRELNKSFASILAGAVFGDHCSPISDTTILSALVSRCAVPAHVRTQLPYSLAVAAVTTVFGSLLNGWGLSEWACLPITWILIAVFVRCAGRPVPDFRPDQEPEQCPDQEPGQCPDQEPEPCTEHAGAMHGA